MHDIWHTNDIQKLNESEIITNFRHKALHKNNGLGDKYDTALTSGIGANILHFEINGKVKNLILTESPTKKAVDLWLDEVFKNDISVFVTLTNSKNQHSLDELNDLDPKKLERYRNGQTVELHHIKNLKNNTNKYKITEQKVLEDNDVLEVWECKINDRLLRHIKFKDLDDAVGILNMKFEDLITKFRTLIHAIINYSPNLNVSFNCFMGVGRARFAAFLFLQFLAHKYKINLDEISEQLINNTVSYPYGNYADINLKIIKSIDKFE